MKILRTKDLKNLTEREREWNLDRGRKVCVIISRKHKIDEWYLVFKFKKKTF